MSILCLNAETQIRRVTCAREARGAAIWSEYMERPAHTYSNIRTKETLQQIDHCYALRSNTTVWHFGFLQKMQ